jgi:hypothetical protein
MGCFGTKDDESKSVARDRRADEDVQSVCDKGEKQMLLYSTVRENGDMR